MQFVGRSGIRLKSFELFKTLATNSPIRKIMRDSYQNPKAILDIVTESKSIWMRFWALVATLSSHVGNREIKQSNKTKEEIVEGFSLRLITLSRACEPVLEVGTDLADSGAQSGSVSNSWQVILPMANYHYFQVIESGPGPLDLNVVVFF